MKRDSFGENYMDRYFFVLNPVAGRGRVKLLKKTIENYERTLGTDYEIGETKFPGHGERLAREACIRGFNNIISVGGDGTLLEVINGVSGEDVSVGIIPCGTGNDFSRALDFPEKTEEQLRVIHRGKKKRVDLGKANGRYFINVFSFGIDALITQETQKIKKYLPGTFAYVAATIKMLMTYRPVQIHMETDESVFDGEVMLVAFGNGQYYGGGMKITPEASLESGDFQVCIVRALSKARFLRLFPKVFSGRHIGCVEVETCRAKNIKVESKDRVLLNADGDIVGECPVEICIFPGSIEIIVP